MVQGIEKVTHISRRRNNAQVSCRIIALLSLLLAPLLVGCLTLGLLALDLRVRLRDVAGGVLSHSLKHPFSQSVEGGGEIEFYATIGAGTISDVLIAYHCPVVVRAISHCLVSSNHYVL